MDKILYNNTEDYNFCAEAKILYKENKSLFWESL
jgi:hypothetical protein